MKPAGEHRQLCTIELIAEGHAERCPGEECPFWERGCALARIEYELDHRPEVAQILLGLRRELEAGRSVEIEDAPFTLRAPPQRGRGLRVDLRGQTRGV